jgi:SARP family transcriptional regulator, regulator of embCAB operon
LASERTRIQICGPVAIEHQGRRIESLLPGRQGRLLFVYLAANRSRPVPRDELIEALWPDAAPSAAEDALSALLSKVRRALGADALEGRTALRLALADAWVDLEAASEAIHRAESAVALGEYARAWAPAQVALFVASRGFLPEEDRPWVEDHRRRLDEIRLRALECYAAAGIGIGGTELAAARRSGRELIRLAPYRESGYRHLMEALAAEGNVAEALRVYDELCGVLRENLGVTPSAATRELHSKLLDGA